MADEIQSNPGLFLGTLRSTTDEAGELPQNMQEVLDAYTDIMGLYHDGTYSTTVLAKKLAALRTQDETGVEWTIGATTGYWYRRTTTGAWVVSPPPTVEIGAHIGRGAEAAAAETVAADSNATTSAGDAAAVIADSATDEVVILDTDILPEETQGLREVYAPPTLDEQLAPEKPAPVARPGGEALLLDGDTLPEIGVSGHAIFDTADASVDTHQAGGGYFDDFSRPFDAVIHDSGTEPITPDAVTPHNADVVTDLFEPGVGNVVADDASDGAIGVAQGGGEAVLTGSGVVSGGEAGTAGPEIIESAAPDAVDDLSEDELEQKIAQAAAARLRGELPRNS